MMEWRWWGLVGVSRKELREEMRTEKLMGYFKETRD